MSPQTMAGANMGVGIVGSLLSGIGQHEAGQGEEAAHEYNAAIDLQHMSGEMIASEQRYSQLVGKQATAYAAAGVDITQGSPLLMMAATAGRGGRQAAEIYQSGTEAATLERYYGKIAAWRGTMAGIGTFLKGLGSSATAYLQATGYQPSAGKIPTDLSNPDVFAG